MYKKTEGNSTGDSIGFQSMSTPRDNPSLFISPAKLNDNNYLACSIGPIVENCILGLHHQCKGEKAEPN